MFIGNTLFLSSQVYFSYLPDLKKINHCQNMRNLSLSSPLTGFVWKQCPVPLLPRIWPNTVRRGLPIAGLGPVLSSRARAPIQSPASQARPAILGAKLFIPSLSPFTPEQVSIAYIQPTITSLFLPKLTVLFNTTHNPLDFVPEISENKSHKSQGLEVLAVLLGVGHEPVKTSLLIYRFFGNKHKTCLFSLT